MASTPQKTNENQS